MSSIQCCCQEVLGWEARVIDHGTNALLDDVIWWISEVEGPWLWNLGVSLGSMRFITRNIQGRREGSLNGILATRVDLESSIVCWLNSALGPSSDGLFGGLVGSILGSVTRSTQKSCGCHSTHWMGGSIRSLRSHWSSIWSDFVFFL